MAEMGSEKTNFEMRSEGSETINGSNLYLVFVYGSLKRGYKLHEYLADQKFRGDAVTAPVYALYDCGSYPALVCSEREGYSVSGEVYEVTQYCLAVLDEVEGVSVNLYVPQKVQLLPPFDSQTVLAYIYQQSTDNLPLISSWPRVPHF